METNNLIIIPPEGMEAYQEGNKIKFRPIEKQLTYFDIAKELFSNNATYYTDSYGEIESSPIGLEDSKVDNLNNCTSQKQVEKLLAINKLMNVAKYLNRDWKPDWKSCERKYRLRTLDTGELDVTYNDAFVESSVYFKSQELAQQAIDILGEETIKLALSTDWQNIMDKKAYFHIAGLLEKYRIISELLNIYSNERYKFLPYAEIYGIYGCNKSKWGSGRVIRNDVSNPFEVSNFMSKYPNICSELVFTNSLLTEQHLCDTDGNTLLEAFINRTNTDVIINSHLLERYIKDKYPNVSFISSITKCLTKEETIKALNSNEYKRIIIDGNFIKDFDFLFSLPNKQKCEILVNDVCTLICGKRKEHFEIYDRASLGEDIETNVCDAYNGECVARPLYGMMKFPLFVKSEEIPIYVENGIQHFKIQGRTNYDLDYVETLVYYLVKPEYQLEMRERLLLIGKF